MDNVVAIVQPYELMSVSEQKYVLAEYAREAGLTIDHFVGEDEVLSCSSHCLEILGQSISTGGITKLLLLDGIAARLPQDLFEKSGASGCKIQLVESHKGLRLAG